MNAANHQRAREPSASARAEAAAWIARLHGPQRSPELDAGLRRWLAESPEHARAFERMTDAWELATTASTGNYPRLPVWKRPVAASVWARAAALLLVCGLAALGAYMGWRDPVYITQIGEQRTVRLDDGSRISLNSASRVVVDYGEARRQVRLERGEGFFEVASNPDRPFVVIAGDREVRALGTAFSVRYEPDRLAVVLVEGKVTVSALPASRGSGSPARDGAPVEPASAGSQSSAAPSLSAVTLLPGQRLVLAAASPPKLDTPSVEAVTAWRRGEVVLDKTPFADAIAEMNRYDETRLVIDDAAVAGLLVSGIYRTGDSAGFARAVAQMYELTVVEEGKQIHLRNAGDVVEQ